MSFTMHPRTRTENVHSVRNFAVGDPLDPGDAPRSFRWPQLIVQIVQTRQTSQTNPSAQ